MAHCEWRCFGLMKKKKQAAQMLYEEPSPRNPGSPKLRMVSWNLNTMRFGGDERHPKVINYLRI